MATTKTFDAHALMRECYLRSNPSVDLDKVTGEGVIKPGSHRLGEGEYSAILREYGVLGENGETLNRELLLACNMWMLNNGPQLFDDTAARSVSQSISKAA